MESRRGENRINYPWRFGSRIGREVGIGDKTARVG
jgi:hypothetical protein